MLGIARCGIQLRAGGVQGLIRLTKEDVHRRLALAYLKFVEMRFEGDYPENRREI